MIRAAIGISTEPSAWRAAIDATRQVRKQLDGENADWCIAFASSDHAAEVGSVLNSISDALGTPHVVGCTAAGLVATGREIEEGPALGVLAVSSDQLNATPFLFHDEGDQGMTAGVRLGQRLLNSRDSDDMLLVWADAFHVRPDRLLQGLDAVLGRVPVVGGAASARSSGDKPMLFCGDECCSGAVSGLRLGGKFRHAIGVTQGCRPLGEPLRVTRAHENLILELDGRPALDVLRERAPAGLLDDLSWAFNFLFVGLLPEPDEAATASGEYLVRNIISADPDTGVLGIADRVGEGQHIVFAHREARAAEADLRRMLEGISPERTGLEYRFGLYFNCLARGRSLYEAEGVDTALLQQALPGVPLLGFFCNAEIGPLRGLNQLFTYTGVLLLIAE
jgi:small ligand-binding sensory domain FIST